jgi:hypothetical protein
MAGQITRPAFKSGYLDSSHLLNAHKGSASTACNLCRPSHRRLLPVVEIRAKYKYTQPCRQISRRQLKREMLGYEMQLPRSGKLSALLSRSRGPNLRLRLEIETKVVLASTFSCILYSLIGHYS